MDLKKKKHLIFDISNLKKKSHKKIHIHQIIEKIRKCKHIDCQYFDVPFFSNVNNMFVSVVTKRKHPKYLFLTKTEQQTSANLNEKPLTFVMIQYRGLCCSSLFYFKFYLI